MNKSWIAVVLALGLVGCRAEWEKSGLLTLAERGRQSRYTIVVPADPSPSQVTAAKELSKYVREMTGVVLPVATNARPEYAIYLGNGGEELGNDGFRLRATPPAFRIEGGRVHGTLFGVYDFLERYCGCNWFSPTTKVIPEADKITVPATLDDLQMPAFKLRDANWTDHLNDLGFTATLKMNGFRIEYPEELGGWDHRKDTTTGGATFDALTPPRTYFKDHPEWFALGDGVRKDHAQRCLTNHEFLEFLVKQTLGRIRKNYPACKYYAIYQNDFKNACACEGCKAIDEREGTAMGSMLHMANYVAERVAKLYPDVYILTFSYMYTHVPPKHLKPHKNVMIVYCTDEVDFSKPILKSKWKGNKEFDENFKAWRKICNNIYIWDYSANFKYLFMPWECLHSFPENFRYMRDNGVYGLFEEGDHYGTHCVDEPLKTWIIGHLLWNPDQPLEPLIDRFMKGFYGAAAPIARGYYDALVDIELNQRDETKEPLVMWGTNLDDPYCTQDFLSTWSKKFTEALELVKNDPIRRENVYWARHGIDIARLYRCKALKKHSLLSGMTPTALAEVRDLKATAQRVLADFKRVKGLNGLKSYKEQRATMLARVEQAATFDPEKAINPSGKIVVTAKDLTRWERYKVSLVKDTAAMDGSAARLDAASLSWQHWCVHLRTGDFVCDSGAKLKVRVHARVEKTGVTTGDAFTVGTCQNPSFKKRDIANCHVKIDRVKDDGYAWYDIDGLWRPEGDEVLWVANGNYTRYKEPGNPCVKAIYVDAIELSVAK